MKECHCNTCMVGSVELATQNVCIDFCTPQNATKLMQEGLGLQGYTKLGTHFPWGIKVTVRSSESQLQDRKSPCCPACSLAKVNMVHEIHTMIHTGSLAWNDNIKGDCCHFVLLISILANRRPTQRVVIVLYFYPECSLKNSVHPPIHMNRRTGTLLAGEVHIFILSCLNIRLTGKRAERLWTFHPRNQQILMASQCFTFHAFWRRGLALLAQDTMPKLFWRKSVAQTEQSTTLVGLMIWLADSDSEFLDRFFTCSYFFLLLECLVLLFVF